jgi:hypothetical protein
MSPQGLLTFEASGISAKSSLTSTAMGNSYNLSEENTKAGDILVSGISPSTPFGLLRKVKTAKKDKDGRFVVETTEANLNEAIAAGKVPEGKYNFEVPVNFTPMKVLPPLKPQSGPATLNRYGNNLYEQGWTRAQGQAGGSELSAQDIPLPSVGACTSQAPGHQNDIIQACSSAQATLLIGLEVGWRWAFIFPYPYIQEFRSGLRFAINQSFSSNLQQVGGKFFNPRSGEFIDPLNPNFVLGTEVWNVSNPIMSGIASPIVFFIGPVPVVIVPSYQITWNVNGTFTIIPPTYSVPFGATFTMGVRYTDGMGWYSINGANTDYFQVVGTAPQFVNNQKLRLQASAKAGITAKAGLYLYGIYGPEAGVTPSAAVTLAADYEIRRVTGNATLSLSAYAGIYGNILGLGLLPSGDFFRWEPSLPYQFLNVPF